MVPNDNGPSPLASTANTSIEACTDGDRFPRVVAKTAVAQICESAGFHSIQLSALETLADIAIRYLSDIGKASQYYANLAGRTQSNALDVVEALEDVNGGIGGGGLADIHRPVSSSGTVRELLRFVEFGEEIPFSKPLPHFPIIKKRLPIPSFSQLCEQPPHPSIPPWLPAFPDSHTYKSTPVWNARKSDPKVDKLEQARQRRKAERSLVSLYLRLGSTGASPSGEAAGTGTGTSTEWGGSPSLRPHMTPGAPAIEQENNNPARPEADGIHGKPKSKRSPALGSHNPFLAPPLPPDAKEVSSLAFMARDTQLIAAANSQKPDRAIPPLPSVLEAFAPALEAVRRGFEQGTDDGSNKRPTSILPDSKDRTPVFLTLDLGRRAHQKAFSACLSLGGKDRKKLRIQSKEEEKDEKKRRAEQILAQSMEGADDTVQ